MLKNVLIGSTAAYTTAASPYLLASGEIGVYSKAADGTYTLITAAITPAQGKLPIVIAQGVPAGNNIKLFEIQPGKKKAYLNSVYAAPVPNVYNIGYDGLTYDLVSGAAGTYGFNIKNTTTGNPPFPALSSTPYFNTAGQATSAAIASAVVKDMNYQTFNASVDVMPENRFALVEMLSGAASLQLVTSVPANITGTVTNGSTTVVLSGSTVGGTTPLLPGSYLRIGNATTTLFAIYKVIANTGTVVTLDSPYVNPSVAIGVSIAGVALGYATEAAVVAAPAGIRATEFGNMFNGTRVQEAQANKIMSVACSVNASGTPVQNNTVVAKAYVGSNGLLITGIYTEGNGTYPQVLKKELTAAGYWGFINRIFLPDNFPIYSVSGTNYTTMGLEYFAEVKDFTAQGFVAGELLDSILAVPQGTAQAATLNTILASTDW